MSSVRLGTRGSALALAQSGLVARMLEQAAALAGQELHVELVPVRTRGDVDPTALSQLGGVGVFATALREALLAGECDLAVHSYKDLPTATVPGLRIAAVPPREDPRDVLCTVAGTRLAQLPDGARVGTGSPRRAAQLLAQRPDLEIVPIRGNVPTRLARVVGSVVNADGPMGATTEPDLDAVVLALSGMRRLGLEDYASQPLAARCGARSQAEAQDLPEEGSPAGPEPWMLPAAAQGALAVETRDRVSSELPVLAVALALVDDPATRACADAERSLMRELAAGCAAPVGALARPLDATDEAVADRDLPTEPGTAWGPGHDQAPAICLEAVVASLDGTRLRRASATGRLEEAEDLGRRVAERLLADGAAQITDLQASKGRPGAGSTGPHAAAVKDSRTP
ncbi:hydroxymethylbilane synthase [Actinomyces faecalis]|uniref:hydroxymethylbilane synthase n=1 Tax=Actinomyces faecalis TaxID=2722820 RepID=UPI0015554041|nr:hydroxymethylbilane synthase [Actinomyces faecalis]